jgi:hypothetical protein
VLDVERDESPIELRWLVNQKRGLSTEKSASAAPLRYRAYALQPAEKRLGFKAHAPGYMMSNLVDARINREPARERTRGFPNFDDIHPQR